MARAATKLYVPLDVNFFDDAKVLAAGEAAAYLYLTMCARAKLADSDGLLTREQVKRLSVVGWTKRLARLVECGLVEETLPGTYVIAGWLNWNESKADRDARLARDRERKKGRDS